jgi:hypothetical protein
MDTNGKIRRANNLGKKMRVAALVAAAEPTPEQLEKLEPDKTPEVAPVEVVKPKRVIVIKTVCDGLTIKGLNCKRAAMAASTRCASHRVITAE